MTKAIKAALGLVCAMAVSGAGLAIGPGDAAMAAGPSYDITNRARIEQDIRRNYNNYNRNLPTSPIAPRREQHLRDGPLMAPSAAPADVCAYPYGRWKRTGSKYWKKRYDECAG